jgi:hypothetical protein
MDAEEDTTPGDLDNPVPPETQSEGPPAPNGEHVPSDNDEPAVPVPSPEPEPAPRQSACLRKMPTRPGNIYGECRHPTRIEKDIQWSRTWRKMTEHMPSSFRDEDLSEQPTNSNSAPPRALSETPLPDSSDHKVDDLLCLQREGGVKYLEHLLAKAVPPSDLESPDSANIHEWTFRDILKMPSASQKDICKINSSIYNHVLKI